MFAGLHATAVHPGLIMTALGKHLDPAEAKSLMTPEVLAAMKSPEQGAATTVWAAVGRQWEGVGGKYLEDCSVSQPFPDNFWAPHLGMCRMHMMSR